MFPTWKQPLMALKKGFLWVISFFCIPLEPNTFLEAVEDLQLIAKRDR